MAEYELAVVIPVYNEQDAIETALDEWCQKLNELKIDYRIHAYNDGSKDRSLEKMAAFAERSSGRVIVHDKKNSGHGPTILQGYRNAAPEAEWIFQIDSDNEMGADKFDELWSVRNDYDFLTGHRDGRKQLLPRKIISAVSRLSVRLLYGRSIYDVNTPYRLMRASFFRDIYAEIPDNTFAPNVIISGMAAACGARCHEIDVPQHDRTTGEVSIRKWKLFKAAFKSFAQTVVFALSRKAENGAKCLGRMADSDGFLCGSIIAATLLCLIHCFSFLFWKETPVGSADGAVFYTMGKVWLQGGMPYADAFDHKGPLVYFINMIAAFLGGPRGILITEAAACLLTLGIIGRTVSRFAAKSTVSLSLLLFPLFFAGCMNWAHCQAGNFTEEYAMPAIAYGGYLLTVLLMTGQVSRGGWFVGGLAAGAAFLLKPNFVSIFAVLMLALAVRELVAGRSRAWLEALGWFVLGGLAVMIPFAIYFAANGALGDLANAFLLFNMKYSGGMSTAGRISSVFIRLAKHAPFGIAMLICCAFWFRRRENTVPDGQRALAFWLLLGLALSAVAIFANPFFSEYYLICAIPLLIIAYAMLFEQCRSAGRVFFCITAAIVLFNLSTLADGMNDIRKVYPGIAALYEKDDAVAKALDENGKKLLVLGNLCHLYQVYDVMPCGKFFYQAPLIEHDTAIFERVKQALSSGEAQVVIQSGMSGRPGQLREIDEILKRCYMRRPGRRFDFYVYKGSK